MGEAYEVVPKLAVSQSEYLIRDEIYKVKKKTFLQSLI